MPGMAFFERSGQTGSGRKLNRCTGLIGIATDFSAVKIAIHVVVDPVGAYVGPGKWKCSVAETGQMKKENDA
jgi:hypothetical protein